MNFGGDTTVETAETNDVRLLNSSSKRLRANSQVRSNSLDGNAVVEVYFKDLSDSSKYYKDLNDSSKDELLVLSSPFKRTPAEKTRTSIRPLSSKTTEQQQERHAKLKVSGKSALDAPEKDWHGIVNFAGKPRYDLRLKKEFYPPPCKDEELIKLRSMTVKYGVNGVATATTTGKSKKKTSQGEFERPPNVNDTPQSRDEIPHGRNGQQTNRSSRDRDDHSWGDSTIEEILGPMAFKSPPPKGGAATGGGIDGDIRPPSAMNDDLPRTPNELCEVLGLDPTVALDLTDHPGFNLKPPDLTSPLFNMQPVPSLNSPVPSLNSLNTGKHRNNSTHEMGNVLAVRPASPHGSGTVFLSSAGGSGRGGSVSMGARATSGVTVMKSPMSSRPGTVGNSRPGTGTNSRSDLEKAREPGLATDEQGLEAREKAVSPLMTGPRGGSRSDSQLNLLSGRRPSAATDRKGSQVGPGLVASSSGRQSPSGRRSPTGGLTRSAMSSSQSQGSGLGHSHHNHIMFEDEVMGGGVGGEGTTTRGHSAGGSRTNSRGGSRGKGMSREIAVRQDAKKLSGLHVVDPDPTSAFTDLTGVDPLWDPANFRQPIGSAPRSPRSRSHRSSPTIGGGSPNASTGRPYSGQGQGLRPLSQGLAGLGLFSDQEYFRDKHPNGHQSGGSGPGSGTAGGQGGGQVGGVGAAPVGVITMCRPGVLEDEKTDKIRAKMFPTTHKKRFGPSGWSGHDPYANHSHRGFMSLLRPIDDEVSLTATASDENSEGDDDSGKRLEQEEGEQEPGISSPTSRYPPSATSPTKRGGGGSFNGTHMPEFASGNGGGSMKPPQDDLTVLGTLHPGSPTPQHPLSPAKAAAAAAASRKTKPSGQDEGNALEYPEGPGLGQGLDLDTGGLTHSGRYVTPALGVMGANGSDSERFGTDQMVNSLFTPVAGPPPSQQAANVTNTISNRADGHHNSVSSSALVGLHLRKTSNDANDLTPLITSLNQTPTNPHQRVVPDIAVATMEKRPRVICALCVNKGALWCKRCDLSYCYECWGAVAHHSPGDAIEMLAKARAAASRPSSASSAMSKSSQPLPQGGPGQGTGQGTGEGGNDRRLQRPSHPHPLGTIASAVSATHPKSRFEQFQDAQGQGLDAGRASPLPPKHFTALAVLEIHPADDDGYQTPSELGDREHTDYSGNSAQGSVNMNMHMNTATAGRTAMTYHPTPYQLQQQQQPPPTMFSQTWGGNTNFGPDIRDSIYSDTDNTDEPRPVIGGGGPSLRHPTAPPLHPIDSSQKKVKMKIVSPYEVKYRDNAQPGYYMDGQGKLNNLMYLDPREISPMEAYLVNGGYGASSSSYYPSYEEGQNKRRHGGAFSDKNNSKSRNSWKLRSKVFLSRQTASVNEKKHISAAQRRRLRSHTPAATLAALLEDDRPTESIHPNHPHIHPHIHPHQEHHIDHDKNEEEIHLPEAMRNAQSSVESHFFQSDSPLPSQPQSQPQPRVPSPTPSQSQLPSTNPTTQPPPTLIPSAGLEPSSSSEVLQGTTRARQTEGLLGLDQSEKNSPVKADPSLPQDATISGPISGVAPIPLLNDLALSGEAQGQGLTPTLAHSTKTTSRSRGSRSGLHAVVEGGTVINSNGVTTTTHAPSSSSKKMMHPQEEARWKMENAKEAKLMTVAPVALLAHHPSNSNINRRGDKEKEKEKEKERDGGKGDGVLVKDSAAGPGLGLAPGPGLAPGQGIDADGQGLGEGGLGVEDKGNDDGEKVVVVAANDSITALVLQSDIPQGQGKGKGPIQSMKDDVSSAADTPPATDMGEHTHREIDNVHNKTNVPVRTPLLTPQPVPTPSIKQAFLLTANTTVRRETTSQNPLELSLGHADGAKSGTVVATIAGGNTSLGGVDNERKVVVYHGVGVFTKDNYKPLTPATTTTTTAATTTTTTTMTVKNKAMVHKPSRPTTTDPHDGTSPGLDVTGVDDNHGDHEGGVKEEGDGEISSPSKGKIKPTGAVLTMSIGTLTDKW